MFHDTKHAGNEYVIVVVPPPSLNPLSPVTPVTVAKVSARLVPRVHHPTLRYGLRVHPDGDGKEGMEIVD